VSESESESKNTSPTSLGLAAAASLVFHTAVAIGWIAHQLLPHNELTVVAHTSDAIGDARGDEPLAIDLPTIDIGTLVEDVAAAPSPGDAPQPLGGTTVPRMDTEIAGHGGDDAAREQALNLSDGDEHMTLSMELMNRLDRDQINRLRVARKRQSWDDRRATKNPSEDSFVQNGKGHVMQRRGAAPYDPSRGALIAMRASTLGADDGAPAQGPALDDATHDDGESAMMHAPANVGGERGSASPSPGTGLSDAPPGIDHHSAALIASARPDVVRGPIAIPANVKNRVMDDQESDQEAAHALQALVHASTAGGAIANDGRGGTGGGGDPGAGAVFGMGSHTRALGVGDGDVFELYTGDPRLMPYFREIKRKVDPLWANAFPKSAIMDLKQGTVILEFTVAADGSATVAWPPVRPSGVDEFDRNCADAIRRASPFPPIPSSLGRGYLRIRAPFIAVNPMVH
jgi:TonB family protein